ncbi:hypothetical protein BH10PLA1_BH10PLA1_10880 [soil metagenome]
MVYLISWRGRGILALPAVLIPIGLSILIDAVIGKYFFLLFTLGFVSIGVACLALGRKWNAGQRLHTLGPMKLETWGAIYGAFGLLLLPAGINQAMHGL